MQAKSKQRYDKPKTKKYYNKFYLTFCHGTAVLTQSLYNTVNYDN